MPGTSEVAALLRSPEVAITVRAADGRAGIACTRSPFWMPDATARETCRFRGNRADGVGTAWGGAGIRVAIGEILVPGAGVAVALEGDGAGCAHAAGPAPARIRIADIPVDIPLAARIVTGVIGGNLTTITCTANCEIARIPITSEEVRVPDPVTVGLDCDGADLIDAACPPPAGIRFAGVPVRIPGPAVPDVALFLGDDEAPIADRAADGRRRFGAWIRVTRILRDVPDSGAVVLGRNGAGLSNAAGSEPTGIGVANVEIAVPRSGAIDVGCERTVLPIATCVEIGLGTGVRIANLPLRMPIAADCITLGLIRVDVAGAVETADLRAAGRAALPEGAYLGRAVIDREQTG